MPYAGLMTTTTNPSPALVVSSFGHCSKCGHHSYLLYGTYACQPCYWEEREHFDSTLPPQSDDWDHVIVNHYRGL